MDISGAPAPPPMEDGAHDHGPNAKTWVSSPMRDLLRNPPVSSFRTGEAVPRGGVMDDDQLSEGTDFDETASIGSDFDEAGLDERAQHAAVYVFEGECNIKFDTHPATRSALQAYRRVHNRLLHAMELACTIGLLALAVFEAPSVQGPRAMIAPVWLSALEVLALAGISAELVLRWEWLGWSGMIRQRRTLFKVAIIAVMIIEAAVVLLRNDEHARWTRCLRPFFLADNFYSAGVRRVLRQMLQALPPIVDMLVLLLFFIFISAIFAFYLFSPNPNDPFFDTLQDSFVSLFVLVTTANFPDVMMPSYSAHPWSFLFFLVYLIFGLYFLQNLLLAVVYDSYRDKEREKFKKLFLHRRQALRFAYRLLKDDAVGGVPFANFCNMMRHRVAAPRCSLINMRLYFIALNESESGVLNLAEFYRFYDASQLMWERKGKQVMKSEFASAQEVGPIVALLWGIAVVAKKTVDHRYFDYLIDIVVVINTVIMTYDAAVLTAQEADHRNYSTVRVEDVVFLGIYWFEICIKLLGHGFKWFWKSNWHRFDLILTVVTTVTMTFNIEVSALVSLRQLRILRLFVVKTRFRRVLGTILSLLPKLVSFFAALFIVFYFFAIIGSELFANKLYAGCCGDYYSNATSTDRYYLNNFDNIFRSFVTLFELMVVNNWFVIMDGFAKVTSNWSRIYFMAFYIFAVIIALNVAIAFVLETFLSRMHFERTLQEDVDSDFIQKHIWLRKTEYLQYKKSWRKKTKQAIPNPSDEHVWVQFVGRRKKNLDDCTMLLFKEEVMQWKDGDAVLPTSLRRRRQSKDGPIDVYDDDLEEKQLIVSFADEPQDGDNEEVMMRDFAPGDEPVSQRAKTWSLRAARSPHSSSSRSPSPTLTAASARPRTLSPPSQGPTVASFAAFESGSLSPSRFQSLSALAGSLSNDERRLLLQLLQERS